jgi:hypothetical protein
MPITTIEELNELPEGDCETDFSLFPADALVREVQPVAQQKADDPLHCIVVKAGVVIPFQLYGRDLTNAGFGVITVGELNDIANRLGPTILERPLGKLPGLEPFVGVERGAIGLGIARRMRDKAPGRRLVILDKGKPVAVLRGAERGISAKGLTQLYGDRFVLSGAASGVVSVSAQARSCPHCAKKFDFYELNDALEYCCPHCHQVITDLQE